MRHSVRIDAPLDECVPDVEVVERLITIDDELTLLWPLQPVPDHGTNEQQLNWCLAAGEAATKSYDQIVKIRAYQREELNRRADDG